MYKKAGLIIVLSLLLIPLVSCTSGPDEQVEQVSLDEFSTFDLDNDGEQDKFVYQFAEEEITENVYLTRTIELAKTDGGTEGKISLQFDDHSQDNDYRHVEDIPKEFASHVDELQFSVTPDEIINPDPEVAWDKEQIDVAAHYLIDITKNFGERDADWVITMTADTVLQYSRAKFSRMEPGNERDKAVLQTASQLTNMIQGFEREQRIQLCGFCSQPHTSAACCAILIGDPEECDAFKLSEEDIDLCRGLYIQDKCDNIADKEAREECYLQNAIDIECEIACNALTDKDKRNLCLAVMKDDAGYCDKIEDQVIYEQCLRECGRSADGSYEVIPFSCDSDCPAPPGGFSLKSCDVTGDQQYSNLYCLYLKTRKCEDWRYKLGVTDEEYTDCTVASIYVDISQWESEELAEVQFRAMTEGKASDSKYLLLKGTVDPDPLIDYDTWIKEYYLDRNYIVQIGVEAVGESEAGTLLAQIKPGVMSVISRTE